MFKRKTYEMLTELSRPFFYSPFYIALMTLAGIFGFVFSRELEAIFFIAFFLILNMIIQRDVLPSFINFVIIGMIPLARYGDVDYFVPVFWMFAGYNETLKSIVAQHDGALWFNLIGGLVITMIFVSFFLHMLIYPVKFKRGRFFYPTLFVAVSILLGGAFYLPWDSYFSFPGFFYVIFLGPVMVLIYLFIENYLPHMDENRIEHFAKMMVYVGIMGIVMGVIMPAAGGDEGIVTVLESGPGRRFQWRNNLSNNLLMSMPFAFYLAVKGKWFIPYFLLGVLQYVILVFSYSRGGIIFSTLILPFLMIGAFIFIKGNRLKALMTLSFVLAMLHLVFLQWDMSYTEVAYDVLERIEISRDEARARMFFQALERFSAYPVFGTGLATDVIYSPQPMAMQWYHSTVSQVLGSLGLLGVLAYTYQELVRLYTVFEVKAKFNFFALMAFMGFAGYSLVNVGYFVPLPYVTMLMAILMIVERYNKTMLKNEDLYEKEKLPFKFLNGQNGLEG